jgi:hypothetical protein
VDWKSERRIEEYARRSVGTRTFYYFIVPVPYFYRDRVPVRMCINTRFYICEPQSSTMYMCTTYSNRCVFFFSFSSSCFLSFPLSRYRNAHATLRTRSTYYYLFIFLLLFRAHSYNTSPHDIYYSSYMQRALRLCATVLRVYDKRRSRIERKSFRRDTT